MITVCVSAHHDLCCYTPQNGLSKQSNASICCIRGRPQVTHWSNPDSSAVSISWKAKSPQTSPSSNPMRAQSLQIHYIDPPLLSSQVKQSKKTTTSFKGQKPYTLNKRSQPDLLGCSGTLTAVNAYAARTQLTTVYHSSHQQTKLGCRVWKCVDFLPSDNGGATTLTSQFPHS